MVAAVSEVIWLVGLLQDIGVQVPTLIDLFCDNKVAIQIASNPMFHERMKHIEIDCHFVMEKLHARLIKPAHLFTTLQLADLLTKGLGSGTTSLSFIQAWSSRCLSSYSLRGCIKIV